MKELSDTDPMPWGMHRGKQMAEIPADYLFYLWTHGKKEDKWCPVADYIRRNKSALELEHKDGIW
jgi:hypothetical protein